MARRMLWLAGTGLSLLALGLAGCARPLAPVARDAPRGFLPPTIGQAALPAVPGTPAAPAMEVQAPPGEVLIRVSWPPRDAGYRLAALPLSTNAIRVRGLQGQTVVGEAVVVRAADGAPATASVKIKPGNNISLEAAAFREAEPTAQSVAIAKGNATINVLSGRRQTANLTLAPLFVPAIATLSANIGRAGDTIDITGENLDLVGTATPTVTLGDATVSAVTPLGPTTLRLTIPAGAVVGPLAVWSDGLKSVSNAVLWVVNTLSLAAPSKPSWDTSAAGMRLVFWGDTLTFAPTSTWALKPGSSATDHGTPPGLVYQLSNAAAGGIVGDAFVPAATYASADLNVALGPVKSNVFTVVSEDLAVSVTPARESIGRATLLDAARYSAVATLSDGSTNSLCSLAVSDPAKVSLTAEGVTSAANALAYGTFTITARSLIANRSATASLTVTNYVATLLASGAGACTDGAVGTATAAWPWAVAALSAGSALVSDRTCGNVRTVGADGAFSSLASGLTGALGVAADASGNAYLATDGDLIYRIAPAGTARVFAGTGARGTQDGATSSATFSAPHGIAIDGSGNVFVAEYEGWTLRKIDASGTVSTLLDAASLKAPLGVAVSPGGQVFIGDADHHRILMLEGATASTYAGVGVAGYLDGPASTARFYRPGYMAFDGAGAMLVTDVDNACIRKIAPATRVVSTVAGECGTTGGDLGEAALARFYRPMGLATLGNGDILVADAWNSRVVKLKRVP